MAFPPRNAERNLATPLLRGPFPPIRRILRAISDAPSAKPACTSTISLQAGLG